MINKKNMVILLFLIIFISYDKLKSLYYKGEYDTQNNDAFMKILGNYNIEYMRYYYNLKPSAMDEGDMVYLECGLVVYILGSEIDEYQYKIKINKFINDYLNDIKEIKKMSKLKNRSNFENNELLYFSDYFDKYKYISVEKTLKNIELKKERIYPLGVENPEKKFLRAVNCIFNHEDLSSKDKFNLRSSLYFYYIASFTRVYPEYYKLKFMSNYKKEALDYGNYYFLIPNGWDIYVFQPNKKRVFKIILNR